jgi:Family of unknown function (DUF6533)
MVQVYTLIAGFGELRACVCNPPNSVLIETALLAYDSLLSMPLEIEYIWKTKFKLGTALYLPARYAILLYLSVQIILESLNFTSIHVCFFEFC